jgi:hypothetical protein
MTDFNRGELRAVLGACRQINVLRGPPEFMCEFVARRLESAGDPDLAGRVRALSGPEMDGLCAYVRDMQGQGDRGPGVGERPEPRHDPDRP